MPRFVILTHDWPTIHWDFLVEAGPALRAWRLLSEPTAGEEVRAEPNADHRLFYLDYEGPVSGSRGCVSCWDRGPCHWIADEVDRVEVELRGTKLAGHAVIQRVGEVWNFHLTAPAEAG